MKTIVACVLLFSTSAMSQELFVALAYRPGQVSVVSRGTEEQCKEFIRSKKGYHACVPYNEIRRWIAQIFGPNAAK